MTKPFASCRPLLPKGCALAPAIDDKLCCRKITGDVVTPKRTGRERADEIQELVETVDPSAIHDRTADRTAIEKRPDIAAKRAVLGVAEARSRRVSTFTERAGERAGETRARRHHDRTGDRVRSLSSDEKFIHGSPRRGLEGARRILEIREHEAELINRKTKMAGAILVLADDLCFDDWAPASSESVVAEIG